MSKPKLLREYDAIIEAAMKTAEKLNVYLVFRINKNDEYNLRWRDKSIEDVSTNTSEGVGLYVFTKSGHLAFGSTNTPSVSTIKQLVINTTEVARANEAVGADKAPEIYDLPFQENLGEDDLHYQAMDMAAMPQQRLAEYAAELEELILRKEPSAKPIVRFSIHQSEWRIVRSDGTDVDFTVPYSIMVVGFVLNRDGAQANGYVPYYMPRPLQLVAKLDNVKELLLTELQLAAEQLTAEPASVGNFPILITDKLAGLLTHEALGHPAESDSVSENGSVLGNDQNKFMAGSKVAADGVTITDHEEDISHGFHPYGAFGNKREPITIIKDGILKESISDIFTAHKTGVTNKNAERSEHYGAIAIPRMSTTYIALSKEKLLAESLPSALPTEVQKLLIEKKVFDKYPTIYYLIGGGGGQVSSKSGDFMFGTHYAYLLTKDSVVATKPVSFSGNVLEALKSIEFGVGKLEKRGEGICGKAGQSAYVSDGGNELVFFAPSEHVSIA